MSYFKWIYKGGIGMLSPLNGASSFTHKEDEDTPCSLFISYQKHLSIFIVIF